VGLEGADHFKKWFDYVREVVDMVLLIISLIPFLYVPSYSPVSLHRTTPWHFETFESTGIP
jgi:hypothetical protein